MKTLDDFAGVLVTGGDLAGCLVAVEPVGGSWLRLDTPSGSALIRAKPGVSLDHDSGLMRMSARDGRTVVVSGVDDQQFNSSTSDRRCSHSSTPAGSTSTGRGNPRLRLSPTATVLAGRVDALMTAPSAVATVVRYFSELATAPVGGEC